MSKQSQLDNVLGQETPDRKHFTADGLPDFCYTTHPETDQPIRIFRGEEGYHPPAYEGVWVDEINGLLGITHEQEKAMLMGSMFGWDTPAADPKTWEKDRKFQAKLLSEGKLNAKKMRAAIARAIGEAV